MGLTDRRIDETASHRRGWPRRLAVGAPLLLGALAVGGCVVAPAPVAYGPPQPVYVTPAPVYVAPAPVYVRPVPAYGWWGHGWRRHGRW
jgi:hypothetical protein